MDVLFFLLALAIGGIASWQIFNWVYGKRLRTDTQLNKQEATVLLERIEKVFKVVLAEGYFTEIYDHQSKKEHFGLFKTNKKALVVAKAKVMVGFDFAKFKTYKDLESKKLIVEHFPEPEVLSIDTDYKFYDIEQGWLNKFSTEDYTNLLTEAKKTMQDKALSGDLPRIANQQVQVMITQLAAAMNWDVEYKMALPQKEIKLIESSK